MDVEPVYGNNKEAMMEVEPVYGKNKEVEPVSRRRGPYENSKAERARKAARGDEVVKFFNQIIDLVTIPMIKQQLIMRDIDFPQKSSKRDLETIIASNSPDVWKETVDGETVKKIKIIHR